MRKRVPHMTDVIAKVWLSYLYSLYLTNSTTQKSPDIAIKNAGPVRMRKITKLVA